MRAGNFIPFSAGGQTMGLWRAGDCGDNGRMPTYVYQPTGDDQCRYCMNGFEWRQKISAPALERCPECGSAIRRVISAPALTSSGPAMDEKNIDKHGFTQYRKLEKGVYEKTAGKGPAIIDGRETGTKR
ncbi:FmdB family zinc ribbon protein [Marinihelvus fidelis]|uniref:FmdB family zinc ribbon protein n=1 Tax=Marinihelvus fidelis TaxID=2613842 RepID=UPI00177D8427|nr:zinc ribbon domain-containing protein [Marinihelvus fidelis]